MDTGTIIAIAVIGSIVAISVLITFGLERRARWRLTRHFHELARVLDAGTANLWPGPEMNGSFHGRQLHAYRRTETVGFTARGGTNGKTIFQFACSTPLELTMFTFPQWPLLAELLRLASPRVVTGDPNLDRNYGFATSDLERFGPWVSQPENAKAALSLMSLLPPSRRQRFRVRVAGRLELNMPEYLYFKMQPEEVKLVLEALANFAGKLEQAKE